MTYDRGPLGAVVIGAGQAGLSVAFYLQRLGLVAGRDFRIVDRGPGTGGAWQHRWDALRIGSAHRINDLPGMKEAGISFDNADRSQPASHVVADYYRRYEELYQLRVHRPATLTGVFDHGTDLTVHLADPAGEHEVRTDVVVNATGTWGSRFIPWYPGFTDFDGRHVHTSEYVAAREFAGQSVVVVGGGTSAIGFLLELENVASDLTWVTRRAVDFLDEGDFDLEARLSAVATQDEAAREGRALPSIVNGTGIPKTRRIAAGIERGLLVAKPMFSRIEPDGVRFANGSFVRADAGGIEVGDGVAGKDGRIFFADYGPQASTIGANRAGRTIARQVVAAMGKS